MNYYDKYCKREWYFIWNWLLLLFQMHWNLFYNIDIFRNYFIRPIYAKYQLCDYSTLSSLLNPLHCEIVIFILYLTHFCSATVIYLCHIAKDISLQAKNRNKSMCIFYGIGINETLHYKTDTVSNHFIDQKSFIILIIIVIELQMKSHETWEIIGNERKNNTNKLYRSYNRKIGHKWEIHLSVLFIVSIEYFHFSLFTFVAKKFCSLCGFSGFPIVCVLIES